MWSFNQWWKLNKEKPIFSQPYKCVTLFLNHLRGLNIEDWADEQQKTMDDDIATGHGDDNEHHWIRFKATFEQTYTDLGEKLSADTMLQNLRMEKGDIDTYIATFNKLLGQAGYKDDEHSTLNMFKRGLLEPLNVRIINNTSVTPHPTKPEGLAESSQGTTIEVPGNKGIHQKESQPCLASVCKTTA